MDPVDSSSLAKAYEPKEVERKWLRDWEEARCFRAEVSVPKAPYCIVIPPPNVTGSLHMGHAMYVLQDILVRYHRMNAYNAVWIPGVDHAGIATQLVVERMIQREEGKSRHELGRSAFTERVWAWKEQYGHRIEDQLKTLGFSLDWSRNRFTMDEGSSQAVLEAFVQLYQEGLIYRARRLINWCTRCATALSDLEVEATETKGKLWHLSYSLVGGNGMLTVATTRPETLLGDTAVAVHPEDPRYQKWIGKHVYVPLTGRTIPIIADAELVSMEFGTGVVKVTPGHDFRDFETGERHGLPMISILHPNGTLNEQVPHAFRGLTVAAAREAVLAALQAEGCLVEETPHVLQQGRCQRCGTVVEPLLSTQWFVKTAPLAQKAVEAVQEKKTQFVPATYTDEFFRWMNNIRDWCISRQLWWGHRIPAWYDLREEGKVYVARTEAEAVAQAGHAELRQDEDVLDTWFSSALWPFSTLGWPEQTRELRAFYPNAVLETGHDILFFWVARMMMMGIHLTGKIPFRTVLLHGLVVDETGEKMSKVKGNVIDPLHLIHGASVAEIVGIPAEKAAERQTEVAGLWKKWSQSFPSAAAAYPKGFPALGADALRFYLTMMSSQERTIRLSIPRIEGYRHFLNKIWSAARFLLMNAQGKELDPFFHRLYEYPENLPLGLAEKWILSRLQRVIGRVRAALQEYDFSGAAQALYQFFWNDVCDWYIEACKLSLQQTLGEKGAYAPALCAVGTLAVVLEQSLRLLHPFVPFITEEVWPKIPRYYREMPELLIDNLYPSAEPACLYEEAEQDMAVVQTAVSGIRSLKSTYQIARAGARFVIKVAQPAVQALLQQEQALVKRLAQVEEVDVVDFFVQSAGTLALVAEGLTVFLPDAAQWVDIEPQRARMVKEQAKLEKELASLQQRLANPDFLARAQAEVVAQTRTRVDEVLRQLEELRTHQQALASV